MHLRKQPGAPGWRTKKYLGCILISVMDAAVVCTALTSAAFSRRPLWDSAPGGGWGEAACPLWPMTVLPTQVCISRCQPRCIPASQRLRNARRGSDYVCITYRLAAVDLIMAPERLVVCTLLTAHCWSVANTAAGEWDSQGRTLSKSLCSGRL